MARHSSSHATTASSSTSLVRPVNASTITTSTGSTAMRLMPALNAAFCTGGVQLIVVPIDYSENPTVLINELRSAALDR